MAYNNGFPINYPYYQQPIMPQPVMPQQPQQHQQYPVVQGGFVRVMNENEARMYPVAPGNSVTFIDESAPYCYTKTVDMSQLDRPKFEKYRLVKEEDAPEAVDGPNSPSEIPQVDLSQYATKQDIEAFRADVEAIKQDIETFRGDLYGLAGKKTTTKKKEVVTDE